MIQTIFKFNWVFLKTKYKKYFPAGAFIAGFLFDIVTAGPIDQAFSIIQQAIFILICGLLISWDWLKPELIPARSFAGIWNNRKSIIHFCFWKSAERIYDLLF